MFEARGLFVGSRIYWEDLSESPMYKTRSSILKRGGEWTHSILDAVVTYVHRDRRLLLVSRIAGLSGFL